MKQKLISASSGSTWNCRVTVFWDWISNGKRECKPSFNRRIRKIVEKNL